MHDGPEHHCSGPSCVSRASSEVSRSSMRPLRENPAVHLHRPGNHRQQESTRCRQHGTRGPVVALDRRSTPAPHRHSASHRPWRVPALRGPTATAPRPPDLSRNRRSRRAPSGHARPADEGHVRRAHRVGIPKQREAGLGGQDDAETVRVDVHADLEEKPRCIFTMPISWRLVHYEASGDQLRAS